jgi:hypothetical protein
MPKITEEDEKRINPFFNKNQYKKYLGRITIKDKYFILKIIF